jgi:diaminohydroxyphosphoribosylaminopyrimidine deaminase/5-amino-6-(5-phosphoribosylamino)uracil reductase
MALSLSDFAWLQKACALARNGRWTCSPNPMVGAVVVQNSVAVGEGYHHRIGQAHAEIGALRAAGAAAHSADLFVSLEPCSTHGRTPPCTQAIIAAGISRVVIGTIDPNPMHAGRALDILAAHAITVEVANDQECIDLNERFNHYITAGTPFIHAKWAMTLDGKIATHTGDSQWISNAASREYTHKLRSEYDAIMVGIGTVLADDPLLNVRLDGDWRQPVKVVVDSKCRIPLDAQIFKEGVTILACGAEADPAKIEALRHAGVEIMKEPSPHDARVNLPALLSRLGAVNISGILVEGGGILLGSLLDQRLVHRVTACVGPKIIGGHTAPGPVGGLGVDTISDALELEKISYNTYENDIMITGVIRQKTKPETANSKQ